MVVLVTSNCLFKHVIGKTENILCLVLICDIFEAEIVGKYYYNNV